MGLTASIYKSTYDASNGGISSKAAEVCIVNAEGPFNPTPEHPAVVILRGHLQGTVRCVPVEPVRKCSRCGSLPDGSSEPICSDNGLVTSHSYVDTWQTLGHSMFGGAYVATSDSRFRELVESVTEAPFYGAVALHDRFE